MALGDELHWIINKASEQYDKWRQSRSFVAMLERVRLNTMRFWNKHVPNNKIELTRLKVGVLVIHVLAFV